MIRFMLLFMIVKWDEIWHYYYKIFKFIDKSDWSIIPDKLQAKDWELLVEIKIILSAFFWTTKHLKRNTTTSTYGELWEVVIRM